MRRNQNYLFQFKILRGTCIAQCKEIVRLVVTSNKIAYAMAFSGIVYTYLVVLCMLYLCLF